MAPITTLISRFSLIKEFSAVPFTEKPMMNKGTRAPFITTRNSAARQKNRMNSKFQAGAGDPLPPSLECRGENWGTGPSPQGRELCQPCCWVFPTGGSCRAEELQFRFHRFNPSTSVHSFWSVLSGQKSNVESNKPAVFSGFCLLMSGFRIWPELLAFKGEVPADRSWGPFQAKPSCDSVI